jgi:hypothetical protein
LKSSRCSIAGRPCGNGWERKQLHDAELRFSLRWRYGLDIPIHRNADVRVAQQRLPCSIQSYWSAHECRNLCPHHSWGTVPVRCLLLIGIADSYFTPPQGMPDSPFSRKSLSISFAGGAGALAFAVHRP